MHSVQSQNFKSSFYYFENQTLHGTKNQRKMHTFARRLTPSFAKVDFQDFRIAMLNNVSSKIHSSNVRSTKIDDTQSEPKAQNLLRYPALPLKETIDKFLKTVEPLLDPKELAETKEAAEEFVNNDGKNLQSLLEGVAAKEENWLANRWQKMAYFQYRDPVTVFSSPGMTFPLTTFESQVDYLDYTSKLIYAMLKYKEQIDCDKIPVVKMGKLELDNSQFKRVFGTCRIPKPVEDTIAYYPSSKHVVVIHKNNFYKLPVYNKEEKILSACTIAEELKKIVENKSKEGFPFGILSTDFRDNWAKSYEELCRSFENEPSLKEIERSLFTVSLDEHADASKGEELNVQAAQLIHGGGSSQNAANRWMDKTIQLCVNPNGSSGFTYEHSPAEGQPIAMIVDYVLQNLKCEDFFKDGASKNYEPSSMLKLKSNPCIEKYISSAKDGVDKLAKDLHMHILVYKGYGKEFLKKQKLSPDSFVQMALQYAFYSLHGVPGAAYETAHLRIYNGGRTETIRSCSNEAIEFAKAMSNQCDNVADLLRKAVDSHRKYTTEALMGKGVDRHLFGLKLMAIENNLPIPNFYKSPGVIKSSHFRLSTSQVASKYKTFMCYGPLTQDGYGCCYNPRDCSIIFAISSWRSNKETCSDQFAKSLTYALDMMKVELECSTTTKCSKL